MPRLRVQIGGQINAIANWSNTYEFILSGSIASQAALQTVVNSIKTTLTGSTPFKAGIATDTSLLVVKGLFYPTNTGTASLVAESPGTAVFGATAPQHAPQVCVVASLRTGTAGRSYRGRVYVPFRTGNVSAGGVVSSAGQTIVDAHVNSVVAAVGVAIALLPLSGSWVVWSPKLGTGSAVSAVLVGSQCDTQRKRNDNRDEIYTSFAVTPLTVAIAPEDPDAEEKLEILNAVANAPIFGGRGTETLQGIIGLAVIEE